MKVLCVLEATTNMMDIESSDYEQIKKFFEYLFTKKQGYNFSLPDAMRHVLTIKSKKSALRVVGGSGEDVTRSNASVDVDRESNLARGFSPDKDVNIGVDSRDALESIGKALEYAGYANIDYDNPRNSAINNDATSRLLKFSNTVYRFGNFVTVNHVYKNFDKAVEVYKDKGLAHFGRLSSDPVSHGDIAKEQVSTITPNLLIFISSVVKKKGRSEAWDKYLNPANYSEGPLSGYTPSSYDPEQAARDLIHMGLTTKTPDKGLITLNKDAIKQSVSALRDELEPLKKNVVEQPNNVSGNLKSMEINAKTLIDKMEKMAPNDIKKLAESKLVAALQKVAAETGDEDYVRAYKFYTSKLDSVVDDAEGVGTASRGVKQTHLGMVFALLRARIIGRMLYYYASIILGDNKKWKNPNSEYGFTGPKELSMFKKAFVGGHAMKKSRLA